jgi:uncharacterized protein YdeI (YjbR/CyaY-like superfamily)
VSEPIFFESPSAWRDWLAEHHTGEAGVLVGYWKQGTGRPSMTWSESVDEALCFGWIDGVRRGLDDERYTIRFTPRKKSSTWSAVNIAKVEQLLAADRMTPAGIAAFAARKESRSAIYSYEQPEPAALPEAYEQRLRADAAAAEFFDRQPPSYRRAVIHWVVSAKQEATRVRRLEQLVSDSAAGRRIKQFVSPVRR